MTSWFWNPEEWRLRALWRILLQVAVMFVIVALPVVGITEATTRLFKSGWIHCSPQVFDKVLDIIVGILMSGLVLLSLFVHVHGTAHGVESLSGMDFRISGQRRWGDY